MIEVSIKRNKYCNIQYLESITKALCLMEPTCFKITYYKIPLYTIFKKIKILKMENRLVVARDYRWEKDILKR